MIERLEQYHGKTIKRFAETWSEDKNSVEFCIFFEDGTYCIIEPYIDKNVKFERNRKDLRLKYT